MVQLQDEDICLERPRENKICKRVQNDPVVLTVDTIEWHAEKRHLTTT